VEDKIKLIEDPSSRQNQNIDINVDIVNKIKVNLDIVNKISTIQLQDKTKFSRVISTKKKNQQIQVNQILYTADQITGISFSCVISKSILINLYPQFNIDRIIS
ncbi:hypothetical protein ACH5RR_031793, partial [Cinchona calisaya]